MRLARVIRILLLTRFVSRWGVLLLLPFAAECFIWVTAPRANEAVAIPRRSGAGRPRPGAYLAPTDLSSWKNEMAMCARPGPNVRRFVNRFSGKPPEQMAHIYKFIVERWHYEADQDRDWLTPAEDLFGDPKHVAADCKAFAIALAACARALNIDAEIVATKGKDAQPGHVQTRVKLSLPEEDARPLIARMLKIWGAPRGSQRQLPLIQKEGRTFLVLDGGLPPRPISNLGPVEAVITN
jgi:transglutaminase-like putative cysteine protease